MAHKLLRGMIGQYDPYTRSVGIVASTTNEVEGEAIKSWDLSRYIKNPVVLWGHDDSCLPVGLGKEIDFTPEDGLMMRVYFGSERANPLAEQLACCVAEGLVRAVSVGYDDEGGVAVLHEVSFVSIGADEDAGTPHIDPEHEENEEVLARALRAETDLKFKPGTKAKPFNENDGGAGPGGPPGAFDEEEDDAKKAKARADDELKFKPGTKAKPFGKNDGGAGPGGPPGAFDDEEEEDDEERAAKVAYAARILGLHRARAMRIRAIAGNTNVDAFREFETCLAEDHDAAAFAHQKSEAASDLAATHHEQAAAEHGDNPKGDEHAAAAKAATGDAKAASTSRFGHEDTAKSAGGGSDKGGGKEGGGNPDDRSRDENGRFNRMDANEEHMHFDRASRLGKVQRTSIGGALVPARLGRTGVLTYINPDGTKRRELRLESEVFNPDSLATLAHIPVIDIADHTKIHDPTTWKKVTLGHVSASERDGKFIAGQVVIQDQTALDAIERGDRTDVSLGYKCRLDWTAGSFEGEEYDCIQRNIKYNHVALCPPNRGRSGPDVGLRLDNKQHEVWAESNLDSGEEIMKVIVIDGREYEVGSAAHIAKITEMNKLRLDALEADLAAQKTRADKAEGERDAATAALEKVNTDAKEKSAKQLEKEMEEEKLSKARKSFRRHLERSVQLFKKAFGADPEEDKEEEKEKLDAAQDEMSDRDLQLFAIKLGVKNFDATGKSDDYVTARFDAMLEQVKALGNTRGVNNVLRVAEQGLARLNTDANEGNVTDVDAARKKRDEIHANAWKTPAQASK